jgi:hypothetical protein
MDVGVEWDELRHGLRSSRTSHLQASVPTHSVTSGRGQRIG